VSNPLGREINKVIKKLEAEAIRLEEQGKFVSVVICTQGVPTNEFGESSSSVMKDCLSSLKALSRLPVRIVFVRSHAGHGAKLTNVVSKLMS
jgi:hypothetical protein